MLDKAAAPFAARGFAATSLKDVADAVGLSRSSIYHNHLGKQAPLAELILAGETRAVDGRVTALSIIGMAMWTAWWFQPGHGATLEAVADMFAHNACALLNRHDAG